jgi:LacI family transcriptional regulator
MAGVSVGTVDRVLHNRGKVAEDNRKKIAAIIKKYHYRPNALARSLARKNPLRMVTLLPQYSPGEYWEAPEKGIDKAQAEVYNYNVIIEKKYFNQFDVKSFDKAAKAILKSKPAAVLLTPIFRDEAAALAKHLKNNHIPAVYIDSNAEDDYYMSYFGQHSYQSGYVAAHLLQTGLPHHSDILIVHIPNKGGNSNQTQKRMEGFMAYFKENQCERHYRFIHTELPAVNRRNDTAAIRRIFNESPCICAAVVFNSRVHRLANILNHLRIKNVKLIGYDLSGDNILYLNEGLISFLIAQRPEDQGYKGIIALYNRLVFNSETKRINYMPIDILTKFNLNDYIHY